MCPCLIELIELRNGLGDGQVSCSRQRRWRRDTWPPLIDVKWNQRKSTISDKFPNFYKQFLKFWSITDQLTHSVQADMRATPIIIAALINVLTTVQIISQFGSIQRITTAPIAAPCICAGILAWTVTVSQQTFINIFMEKQEGKFVNVNFPVINNSKGSRQSFWSFLEFFLMNTFLPWVCLMMLFNIKFFPLNPEREE